MEDLAHLERAILEHALEGGCDVHVMVGERGLFSGGAGGAEAPYEPLGVARAAVKLMIEVRQVEPQSAVWLDTHDLAHLRVEVAGVAVGR